MYQIIVHRRAVRYMQSLAAKEKERIKNSLAQLAYNPLSFPSIKPMSGQWNGYYRIRLGDKRIIFWVDHDNKTVYVDHVGPRGDVYKN